MGSQYITLTTGSEEYGFDIMAIREIRGWTSVTELPEMPFYMRGLINLRGSIVPILDLRARFHEHLTEPTPRHVVLVLAVEESLVGVLADAVVDILTVQPDDIHPVPDLSHAATHFIEGMVTTGERMVALLDLNKVFDIHRIASSVSTTMSTAAREHTARLGA